jgi:hypothetical protein
MSKIITPLDDLINAFAYPLLKPSMAQSLALQFSIEDIQGCSLNQKLLWSGALLAVGRVDEYRTVVEQTDFSQLSYDDKVTFVGTLFRSFQKYLFGPQANALFVDALLCMSRVLLPSVMFPSKGDAVDAAGSENRKKLIELSYASRISPHIKGIVFFRALFMGPGSRKHEFGLRIQKALASQGWDVSLHSPDTMQSYLTSEMFDFALIDIALLNAQHLSGESVAETLLRIRRNFRKIIIVEPDPWATEHNPLFEMIEEYIDYVWGFTAEWPLLNNLVFLEKAILFPNVGGFDDMTTERDSLTDWSRCSFGFVGSIGIPNLPRIYWALESLSRKLPIQYLVSDPGRDDGMDSETSLYSYARLLAVSHVGVNYVKRLDGSRILTGRTLEVISLKRLLLQESCPAMNPYFIEGEHFLEFSDIESLCTAVEFIGMHPKTAQMIAQEGHDYYLQHYSSKKLVEHFQVLLD